MTDSIIQTAPSDRPLLDLVLSPEEWMQDGLCLQTDPDLFFPEKGGRAAKDAKRVCASCDVVEKCLAYALATDQKTGIWGGTAPVERRALRKGVAA